MQLTLLTAVLALFSTGAQKSGPVMLVPAAHWQLVRSEEWPLGRVHELGLDPRVDREYGVSRIERREYVLRGEPAEVFVFETSDPSAAYGLFSFYVTPQMQAEPGTRFTLYSSQVGFLARGKYLVRVPRPPPEKFTENDFRALLLRIGGTGPGPKTLAKLPSPLPNGDLIPHSEKYILGPYVLRQLLPSFPADQVGFAQGAEVQVGQYNLGGSRPILILITYPTPQIARARFAHLQRILPFDESEGPGRIYGRRSGSYVLLVTGAKSEKSAGKLLEHMESNREVTWDESPPTEVPFALEVVNLILSNLMLIGIIVVGAFGGGFLIFLVRWWIDRYHPQTMLARESDGGMIRLGLDKQ